MLAIFNSLGGGEVIVILVLALIVLGPEKLPEAMRRFGNLYGELRRMSDGFQSELRDAFQDPMQELRGTAQMVQDAVNQPMRAMTDQLREPGSAPPVESAVDEVQEPVDEAQPDGLEGPEPDPEQEPVPADVAAPVLPSVDPDVVAPAADWETSLPTAEAPGDEGIGEDPAGERTL